jgi:hypothetical protein
MIKIALFRILVIGNYLGFGGWDLVLKAHISFPTLINANRALLPLIIPDPE